MLEDYPKEMVLQGGLKFTLRPMTKYDDDGLYRFFVSLAEYDRKHLRNDTQNRLLIERWCRGLNYDKVLPILAEKDKKIIGNATLHRQSHDWSKHIGEIRMTISPNYQQKGLGSLLVNEIVSLAQKAESAIKSGRFKDEIVPVVVSQRRGDDIIFDTDEFPRFGTTVEKLSKLKPAFRDDGTITAVNSSGIKDGGAALVIMSAEKAYKMGIQPLAKIVAYDYHGCEPELMGTGPKYAVRSAINKVLDKR